MTGDQCGLLAALHLGRRGELDGYGRLGVVVAGADDVVGAARGVGRCRSARCMVDLGRVASDDPVVRKDERVVEHGVGYGSGRGRDVDDDRAAGADGRVDLAGRRSCGGVRLGRRVRAVVEDGRAARVRDGRPDELRLAADREEHDQAGAGDVRVVVLGPGRGGLHLDHGLEMTGVLREPCRDHVGRNVVPIAGRIGDLRDSEARLGRHGERASRRGRGRGEQRKRDREQAEAGDDDPVAGCRFVRAGAQVLHRDAPFQSVAGARVRAAELPGLEGERGRAWRREMCEGREARGVRRERELRQAPDRWRWRGGACGARRA